MFYVVRPSLLSCSGENRLGKNNLGRCVASRAMRHGFLKSVAKRSLLAVVHDDFNENCQTNTVYDSGDRNVAELAVTQAGLVQAVKNNPA